jgi:hypothetical protein
MTSTMRFDKWENSLGQPYGAVLQVVQGVLATPVTFTSSGSWVSVGINATITPKFATSKILVELNVCVGSNGSSSFDSGFGLFRNGTQIALPTSFGSRMPSILPFADRNQGQYEMVTANNSFLDTPSTTLAITYDLRAYSHNNTNAKYINRTGADADGFGDNRMISTITLTEIAQ